MKHTLYTLCIFVIVLGFSSCKDSGSETKNTLQASVEKNPQGKLFIIGGGKRPPELVRDLIKESGISKDDEIAILPMASVEPDSSFYYASLQFEKEGYHQLINLYTDKERLSREEYSALAKAKLIYIPGGDQVRFMQRIKNTGVRVAIEEAYQNGSTIAGTSAGAAVMSWKMITGNQLRHKEYSSTPAHIQSQNIELSEGLGLLPTAIIDQHFVQRSRYNRILSTVIEHPDLLSIGIDESTALCVTNGKAKVYGEAQVIVLQNPERSYKEKNSNLGARDLRLHVYLPGDEFEL